MVALQKKTNVRYKNSGIYSVSRTFWPLDFGSFFWGGAPYINNTYKIDDMKWRDSQKTIIQLFLPYDAIKLNNWKTESIWRIYSWMSLEKKTVFPQIFRNSSRTKTESIWRISSWMSLDKNMLSVLQFFLAIFRNSSRTKTEKLNPYGESLPGSLWKKQFFSVQVLVLELFRNSSGSVP